MEKNRAPDGRFIKGIPSGRAILCPHNILGKSKCNLCINAWMKNYINTHPEFKQRRMEYRKRRREANREQINKAKRLYYLNNKEEVNKVNKEYYDANKERINNANRERYKNNSTYREKVKEWRRNELKRNPRVEWERKIRSKYGMSKIEFEELLKEQDNKCAICRIEFAIPPSWKVNKVNIDHNHQTNTNRGLLCSNCNLLMGHCHENPKLLEEVIHYLNYWNNLNEASKIEPKLNLIKKKISV